MRDVTVFGRMGRPKVLLAAAAILLWGLPFGAGAARASVDLHLDPQKVMGPDACGECHKSSLRVWKGTQHFKTFKELPRRKKSREIANKLGIKRIKSESLCLGCHFTSAVVAGKTKPIAGIACESCHGAGKDWIKVHSDYGGKDVTRDTEPAAHRQQRFADSEAAGMIDTSQLYNLTANCFGCHTVPNEELVNVGGHTAGSKFELVSWLDGEVLHNVWYTKENRDPSQDRKRILYILGRALDLEFALRGVAKATKKAKYAVSMARRAKAAAKRMKAIAAVVSAPEIDEIIAAAGAAKLKLNNGAQLTAAADRIAAAAAKLSANYDGSAFAGVDALIPDPGKYKGARAK